MRIAVMVISLLLMVVVGFQSCAVGALSSVVGDESTEGGGAVGLLVGFMFLLGGAFSLGRPKVSMVVFVIGAVLALMVGATTSYSDMTVWAFASGALAIMSFFGVKELKKVNIPPSGPQA